jgi:hypothetical protein
MDLGSLFQQVTGLLNNQTRTNDSVDTDGLIGQVAGLFKGHADQNGAQFPDQYNQGPYDNVPDNNTQGYQQGNYGGQNTPDQQAGILPASQDPYGDPADQR